MRGTGRARRLDSVAGFYIGLTAAVAALGWMTSSARAAWSFDTIPSQAPFEPPSNVTAVATYTFESPAFLAGTTTPLLNKTPNSGPAGFTASFTAAATLAGFTIANFQPNPLTISQVLYDPNTPADTLTITFSQPVQSLSFAFATNTPQATGRLALASASGNASQNSANVGGSFPGGTFNFAPANPFTSITLTGFDNANVPALFAIDNLTLNVVVPEPASLGLVVIGLAMLRRRFAHRARV